MASDSEPAPGHHRLTLPVIPRPETGSRAVILYDGPGTVAIDGGPAATIELVCGDCGAVLARVFTVGQLNNLVLRCKACGAFNETLAGT